MYVYRYVHAYYHANCQYLCHLLPLLLIDGYDHSCPHHHHGNHCDCASMLISLGCSFFTRAII